MAATITKSVDHEGGVWVDHKVEQPHPYSLKGVHYSAHCYHESNPVDGQLVCDGKVVGSFCDDGNGGGTMVSFTSRANDAAMDSYCHSLGIHDTYYRSNEDGTVDQEDYPWNAEHVVDDLITLWLEAKDKKNYLASIKRAAKTKLLFVAGDEDPSDMDCCYRMFSKQVYGQVFLDGGVPRPVQDIQRDRLTAKGETNLRFYNPATQVWED
jgi:hypothetical protein